MSLKLSSASAALVGVAAICAVTAQTANAAMINSIDETTWNAATPGATATSASQQGLPTATGLFGGPLPLVSPPAPFAFAINYNDQNAPNTIPGFFSTDSPAAMTPVTCTGPCLTNPLTNGGFANATVMEFQFVETVAETFSVTHDDGVSLFVAGTENSTNSNDLLPLGASAPTTAATNSVNIGPGTYDLWYAEVNGLPAVLEATSTPLAPPTPLPGALPLFATGLGALGLLGWRRKRKARVSLLGAA